jgi:membrane protease YdiL (CAAX protease family)
MKSNNPASIIFSFVVILAVFLLNMTFSGLISGSVLLLTRILLAAFFGAAIIVFQIRKQPNARRLAFTLMIVNLAFFIVSFFTTGFWGLDLETAKGIAFAKLSDSVIISAVLIVAFLVGGYKLKDIYLRRGKLGAGLIIGLLSFVLMGFMAMNNPDQTMQDGFLQKNIAWILIFVFSNAFMEELLFRGIFLKQLNNIMKPGWSILLTSLVFASAHLQVNYTPDVLSFVGITLVLGAIWGFLMQYTKSIIASILFHAGADLLIIIPIYASFGVQG